MPMPKIITIASLLTITVITLAVAAPAMAGGHRGHHRDGPKTGQHIEHMTTTLGLSEEQTRQIRDIFGQTRTDIAAVRTAMVNAGLIAT